jgi:hypothetical protein
LLRRQRAWAITRRGFDEAPYDAFRTHERCGRAGARANSRENFFGVVEVEAYGVDDGVYL